MLTYLNRHVLYPLLAAKRGSKHLTYLKLVEKTQFDPVEVVRGGQLAAVRRLLAHAYATVPYYRRTWQAAGLHPDAVRTLGDLAAFPVLTKDHLREHFAELQSTAVPDSQCVFKTTSGSTGVPVKVRLDEPAKQWKAACTLRADQWSGYRLGQRVAKVWGNPEYRHEGWKGRVRNALIDRAVHLDTVHLTDAKIDAFVQSVRRHPPGLLFGHAHSLYLVADALLTRGITDVRPNGIVSTAMPLHDWQRTGLRDAFGIEPTDRYGCEEVSLIASECDRHRGLHVNADSVYVEVDSGPYPSGTGPILVTDLANCAMPLIRYRTGDVVTSTTRKCPCGRGLPLLEKVEGRDADYVVMPGGGMVSGISLTENYALHIPGVAQVQIVQDELTKLRLRVVPGREWGPGSIATARTLTATMFGPTMELAVETVNAIPQEASGKYRFCISHVAPRAGRGNT